MYSLRDALMTGVRLSRAQSSDGGHRTMDYPCLARRLQHFGIKRSTPKLAGDGEVLSKVIVSQKTKTAVRRQRPGNIHLSEFVVEQDKTEITET